MTTLARRLAAALLTLSLAPAVPAIGAGPAESKIPDNVFAQPPGDDAADVILFGPSRLAVVRVHVKLGDRSFRAAWGDFVVKLHAYLDRNGDGLLTTDEANKAPWTNLLQNPFNGFQPSLPSAGMVAIDSSPKDGKVSFEELSRYLRLSQRYEPLEAQAGPPPDTRAEAVFGQFDRDGDKAISPPELAEAEGLVSRLDGDEDETLSLDEFTPDRSPLADRFGRGNRNAVAADPATSPALLNTTPESIEQVATRILSQYGKPAGRLVGPEPLGASPSAFAAADRDGDGRLDRDELKRYLVSPTPHLGLVVSLPMPRSGTARIEKVATPDGLASSPALKTRPAGNNALAVDFEATEIEFQAGDASNNFGNIFEQQFKTADLDKDGAVDAREARGNFFLQRIHPVADRNGDGKMTAAELKVYVDLNTLAQDVKAAMTVVDRGIALHERLDADRDGRLSRRELREAKAKLADLDLDHDGRVALSELPRRSQLSFGRGFVQNRVINVVQTSRATVARPAGGAVKSPPAWFVGMDRNQDGDVSPREFLGSPDQFREFDADRDGLIDRAEASRTP